MNLYCKTMRLKRKIEVEHNSLYEYGYVEMDWQRIRLQSLFVLDLKGNLSLYFDHLQAQLNLKLQVHISYIVHNCTVTQSCHKRIVSGPYNYWRFMGFYLFLDISML